MKLSGIYFECTKDAYISNWSFDPPAMKAGEVAQVTEAIVLVANPLYLLEPEDGSKPFAAHRETMLPFGNFVNR